MKAWIVLTIAIAVCCSVYASQGGLDAKTPVRLQKAASGIHTSPVVNDDR